MSLLDDFDLNSVEDIYNIILKKLPKYRDQKYGNYIVSGFYDRNMKKCEYDYDKTYYVWAKNMTDGIFTVKYVYFIESVRSYKYFPKEFNPVNYVKLHPKKSDPGHPYPITLKELLEDDAGSEYMWW